MHVALTLILQMIHNVNQMKISEPNTIQTPFQFDLPMNEQDEQFAFGAYQK